MLTSGAHLARGGSTSLSPAPAVATADAAGAFSSISRSPSGVAAAALSSTSVGSGCGFVRSSFVMWDLLCTYGDSRLRTGRHRSGGDTVTGTSARPGRDAGKVRPRRSPIDPKSTYVSATFSVAGFTARVIVSRSGCRI